MEKMFIANETDMLNLMRQALTDVLKTISLPGAVVEDIKPMTVTEAAAFIDRPASTIYNLVRNNEIPHSKKGKRLYFNKADLVAWINQSKVKTKSQIVDEVNNKLSKQK